MATAAARRQLRELWSPILTRHDSIWSFEQSARPGGMAQYGGKAAGSAALSAGHLLRWPPEWGGGGAGLTLVHFSA